MDKDQLLAELVRLQGRVAQLESQIAKYHQIERDRQQVEAALRESQHFIQKITDTVPQVLYLFDLTQGSAVYLNHQVSEMLGYTPEDVCDAGSQWLVEHFHPDDHYLLQNVPARFTHLADHEVLLSEYRLRHKNGEWRWMQNREVVFSRDDNGLPAQILGSVQDITEQKQIELDLHRSNQQLINTLESITDGFFAFDRQGHFTYINRQAEKLLRRDRQDLLGKAILSEFPEALEGEFYRQYTIALHEQRSVVFEAFYPPLQAWFEVHAYPIQDGVAVYFQDVTGAKQLEAEQKRAYEQVRYQAQKEQALNRVVQAIRQSLDLGTIFSTATREIAQLLQADRATIVQYCQQLHRWRVVSEYHTRSDLPNVKGLEERDRDDDLFNALRQHQVVCIDKHHSYSSRLIAEYAASFPGSWLLVPLHYEPAIWGCLTLVSAERDTWQETEIELARTIADQVAIAIQQSQLYHQVQQLNATLESQVRERTIEVQQSLAFEALLKRITDKVRDSLDEQQILQTAVHELATELDLECCDAALYDLEQGTLTICYESIRAEIPSALGKVIHLDEEPILFRQLFAGESVHFCPVWFSHSSNNSPSRIQAAVLACPLMNDRGILGDLWLFRSKQEGFNPLELRLVQQVANQCAIAVRQSRLYQNSQAQVKALEELNRLKDDFLSTVSHELRTPMSNIKLATQMLEIGLQQLPSFQPSPAIERYLKILKEECHRETYLINDLLDITQLESGVDFLKLSAIDLQSWLTTLIEPFQAQFQNQQQSLAVTFPPKPLSLATDVMQLERIIVELLQNACKYTPLGETIAIDARSTPTGIAITIANSGIEISPAEQERIFEKFYRIPNNDPWKTGGTGLGLALVKKRVERLGGVISVSTQPRWTMFTVQIPQKKDSP